MDIEAVDIIINIYIMKHKSITNWRVYLAVTIVSKLLIMQIEHFLAGIIDHNWDPCCILSFFEELIISN